MGAASSRGRRRWSVRVSQVFSAAHFVKGQGGRCEETHGHNYRVEVTVSSSSLNRLGMVVDFADVRARLQEVLPDHRLLNDVYEFSPTAENLARRFYDELSRSFRVRKVRVWENDDCCAEFGPD